MVHFLNRFTVWTGLVAVGKLDLHWGEPGSETWDVSKPDLVVPENLVCELKLYTVLSTSAWKLRQQALDQLWSLNAVSVNQCALTSFFSVLFWQRYGKNNLLHCRVQYGYLLQYFIMVNDVYFLHDLYVTGSGKTLSYLTPIIELIHRHRQLTDPSASPEKNSPQAIILVPTRELADQIMVRKHWR